ncbi:hypothetical protein ACFWXB_13845 [Tsukamurella tyrosinosolvens]|uniref:hypothetical protein n=1 Tax=Tsukamurella tyrosinosolvens TaxID=57704 RepID=UPI0036A85246
MTQYRLLNVEETAVPEYKTIEVERRNLESDTEYHGRSGWRAIKIDTHPSDSDWLTILLERD